MGYIDFDQLDTEPVGINRKKKKLVKNPKMIGMIAVGCVAACALILALGIGLYKWVTEEREAAEEAVDMDVPIMYTQEEMEEKAALLAEEKTKELLDQLAQGVNSGQTLVETLRPLYKDKLVVASSGKYHFVPISDTLKKHNLTNENLQKAPNGELTYVQDGKVITHKGIDVSKYNGAVDWSQVAADGVEFAFIRAGIRGYGSGKLVEDEGFEENVESAITNGIKVGVYFFSQAITPEEAVEEAQFVKQLIAPYRIECPIVIDVEKVSDSQARMNKISVEERTNAVKAFCEEIEKDGYEPMIYYNMEMAALMLDLEQLETYDKWFAYYNQDIYFPYEFKIWQYSDKGRVNGVEGNVDLNIAFEKIWE